MRQWRTRAFPILAILIGATFALEGILHAPGVVFAVTGVLAGAVYALVGVLGWGVAPGGAERERSGKDPS